ncbi:MAG: histone deacetylase [Betaproteobacteria bacterium]|nr:histone deacetylase [Betaproteobacteria bacterium]
MAILRIPVFYCEAMVTEVTDTLSPSAAKPRAVVASWRDAGFPIDIIDFKPVGAQEFSLAHDSKFVAGVLSGQIANGFGDESPAVAATLGYTSGAMLAAARAALDNRQVAVAPCSGFHHAGYRNAGGFCTFNGLIVAAQVLKREGRVNRIGILDFDQHWGDGTEDIIHELGLAWINHFSAGKSYHSPARAEEFLRLIPRRVEDMSDCDVILYQAGADPHIDDPLGGWLTNEQLAQRDRLVFEHAKRCGIPVAWNLAGGYQTPLRKVLDIHDNTMRECVRPFIADNLKDERDATTTER